MRRLLVGWVIATFLCVAGAPLLAQQGTSEIGGKAVDDQEGVPPGRHHHHHQRGNRTHPRHYLGRDGSYFASSLIPGRYKISARLASFRNFERGGLVLAIGQRMTVNVTMSLGALEESVTVSGQLAAGRHDQHQGRWHGRHRRAERVAGDEPQLLLHCRTPPGVQFSPSNQMGNDTIVAGGQSDARQQRHGRRRL